METTLQIEKTRRRLERAQKYLDLMEKVKGYYRTCRYDSLESQADGWLNEWNRRGAERWANVYRWLIDRYNSMVAESLIIAPHMIE